MLFKIEIHEGDDYFRVSEICSTNEDEKYYVEVNKATGKLILSLLNAVKSLIRGR